MEVAPTPKAGNCKDTSQVPKRLVPLWYWRVSFQFALTFKAQCMKHMQWGLMHLCVHLQDMSENSSFTCCSIRRRSSKDGFKMSHYHYRCGGNISDMTAIKQMMGVFWKTCVLSSLLGPHHNKSWIMFCPPLIWAKNQCRLFFKDCCLKFISNSRPFLFKKTPGKTSEASSIANSFRNV